MYIKRALALLFSVILLGFNVSAAESSWAKDAISNAKRMGLAPAEILDDYQKPITREEFCHLALNLYKHIAGEDVTVPPHNPFSDTDNPAVLTAFSLGIVKGVSENEFAPLSPITRQEICVMLSRALSAAREDLAPAESYPNTFPDDDEIADWAKIAVQYMNMLGVMLGKDENRIDPYGQTTREQAIVLTYRIVDMLRKKASEALERAFFPLDGNTDANVAQGAFAIFHGNLMYITDGNELYTAKLGESALNRGPEGWYNGARYENLVISGENIFYSNPADGGAVYKTTRSGGTNTKIADGPASYLYAIPDGVMYLSGSRFYKVKADGSGKTQLLDADVEKPVLSGIYLYFINGEKIHKGRIDTGEITKVADIRAKDLQVINNIIYFINADDSDKLYMIKADGTALKALTRFGVSAFNTAKDWIFAAAADGSGLYKVNYDGTAAIRIDWETPYAINAADEYVYLKGEKGVYKMRSDSTEKAYLTK